MELNGVFRGARMRKARNFPMAQLSFFLVFLHFFVREYSKADVTILIES